MVDHPSAYLWSSYAANSGMRFDPFLAGHPDYSALADDAEKRVAAYRLLVEEGLEPALQQAIRDAANAGYPLASDAFKTNALVPLGWKMEPGKPGPRALSPEAVYALES
jgi:putative transposase